jgi:hydrogenase-4 component B
MLSVLGAAFAAPDPLSLFFLAVIGLVALPCAVFAAGYLKRDYSSKKIFLSWVLFALFVFVMAGVVTVKNAFIFLVFWELMSLVSYFFVIFDTRQAKSIQAGVIYLVMMHLGTAFLTAAFLLIFRQSHSFNFSEMAAACRTMEPKIRDLVFLFLFFGFGTKAGIVPLHIWLPYAHPQAPSHISGIMSGVMIKIAVYGIIRFVIGMLGVDSPRWGFLLLVLALIACLVGAIYALIERDIKKLLAYSSIENMGIILLGVGLGMVFIALRQPYLAIFALAAGLYHLVNHAIFKSLLFLGAGSVVHATGTRDIEKMGGLIKKMPRTAVFFLVGAMAIAALPPFNGFVSEWLLLQAFFVGASQVFGGTKIFLGVGAAFLALTGGLAAAGFVRAFGLTFLALPRSRYAAGAHEAPRSMTAGMGFLASLTLVFGLAASWIFPFLARIAGDAMNIDPGAMNFPLNAWVLRPLAQRDVYLATPVLALCLVSSGILAFLIYKAGNRHKALSAGTWDCAYYKIGSRNEFTATAFSKPFRIAFAFFLHPYRKTQKVRESFYHVKSFAYRTETTFVFKKYIYGPILSFVFRSAKVLRRIQPGSIHVYLAYIFITALLLIVFRNNF